MGRLAGFRYREIIKRLKRLGFEFDRQAAGSHEIWYNPTSKRYTKKGVGDKCVSLSTKNIEHLLL